MSESSRVHMSPLDADSRDLSPNIHRLRAEVEDELEQILEFWLQHSRDEEHGGFYGSISNDLTIQHDAPKGLVLCARLLWTFSRAYRFRPQAEYLEMADRALAYLQEYFLDRRYGGYYFLVDVTGRALVDRKHGYAQAFVLFAVSEYVLATDRQECRPLLRSLFDVIERSHDSRHGGYFEAFTREWAFADDMRLSDVDLNAKKSMNMHLHILEAYTNLLRVWRFPEAEQRLKDVLRISLDRILDSHSGHFRLFFEEDWTVMSDMVSFGHDIEGSWLLIEAAEVLGDPDLTAQARAACITMVDGVLRDGASPDGSILYEARANGWLDDDRHWWPQAEGLVGFLNAYQLSGDRRYFEALLRLWEFIKHYMIDREHGEWFWKVDRDGVPDGSMPKVSAWKCPYHNSRACFEIIDRLSGAVSEVK
jgi:mannobiose 2-epimerase